MKTNCHLKCDMGKIKWIHTLAKESDLFHYIVLENNI